MGERDDDVVFRFCSSQQDDSLDETNKTERLDLRHVSPRNDTRQKRCFTTHCNINTQHLRRVRPLVVSYLLRLYRIFTRHNNSPASFLPNFVPPDPVASMWWLRPLASNTVRRERV